MKHALIAALLLASPAAAADCVTAANLATGIIFKLSDGRSGVAVAAGRNLRISYAAAQDAARDDRVSRFGVFDLASVVKPADRTDGGVAAPHYRWGYSGQLPVPTAGKSFSSMVRQSTSVRNGSQPAPAPGRVGYAATYSFLPAIQYTFGTCKYAAVPVDAAYSDGSTQRWMYFPDLGLGLETQSRRMGSLPADAQSATILKPE